MIIKYAESSKKIRGEQTEGHYLKSIEFCCYHMAYLLMQRKIYQLDESTDDIEGNADDWPIHTILQNEEEKTDQEDIRLFYCPYCGEQVIVYIDDKECKSGTAIDKALG